MRKSKIHTIRQKKGGIYIMTIKFVSETTRISKTLYHTFEINAIQESIKHRIIILHIPHLYASVYTKAYTICIV